MSIWSVMAMALAAGAALAGILALAGLRGALWALAGLGAVTVAGLLVAARAATGWDGLGYTILAIGMALPATAGVVLVALAAWWHDRRRARDMAASDRRHGAPEEKDDPA